MPQRNIKVRVRPARIVVLVNQESTTAEFLLAVEFLSGIWAGRHARIILVQDSYCDSETVAKLQSLKPDFVYGLGVNEKYWFDCLTKVCQPRLYRSLSQGIISQVSDSFTPEGIVSIKYPLVHRHDHLRHTFKNRERSLAVVRVKAVTNLSAICQTYFGIHQEDIAGSLIDRTEDFGGDNSLELIDAIVRFARSDSISWLDLGCHELRSHVKGFRYCRPVVVLIAEGSISDLAHFWNIRSSRELEQSISVLPVPVEAVYRFRGEELIAQWLGMFSSSNATTLGCLVTSCSLSKSECERVAGAIVSAIAGGKKSGTVRYSDERKLPLVIPYEYEANWSVDMKGRALIADPPKSRAFLDMGGVRGLFVDLLKDVSTGRAVGNLSLPMSPVIKDLLNGACPPHIEGRVIPRAGVGVDGISLHCYSDENLVRQYLPSSGELLAEMLREHEVFSLPDEKRKVYAPFINKLGGLQAASQSLSKKADLSDSFNHELYHGDEDQSDTARTSSLKVFGEASGTIEPGKGPLDDPAFGLDFELVGRVFYQLHIPCPANPSPLSGGMIGSVSP